MRSRSAFPDEARRAGPIGTTTSRRLDIAAITTAGNIGYIPAMAKF
jgi:hypothetical protein